MTLDELEKLDKAYEVVICIADTNYSDQDGELIAAMRNMLPKLIKVARAAQFARRELGVPQPGYAAPVANAAEALIEALDALDEKDRL